MIDAPFGNALVAISPPAPSGQPGETRKIGVNTIKGGSRALIVVCWHRYCLLAIRAPFFWLSRAMADEINAAVK
jgi:hypothetical protein